MQEFLGSGARPAFEKAVATIEARSGVEVVVAVRRQSSVHLHAHVAVGIAAAALASAYMLFSSAVFGLWALLFDPLLIGFAAGLSVELAPSIKRLLTPRTERNAIVRRSAESTFLQRRVHVTRGRSGLLVYVSLAERAVVLVADMELEHVWPESERAVAERSLSAAIAEGGVKVAAVLAELGAKLEAVMPRVDGDLNELPDAVDAPTGVAHADWRARFRRGPTS